MSHLSALCTSDPSLVRCELDRLRAAVEFPEGAVAGLGAYADNHVVLKRYGEGMPRADMWEAPESHAVVICAQTLALSESLDESGQPFRFRQWLFGFHAPSPVPVGMRDVLVANLPEFLQRAVKTRSVGEAAFFTFLAGLREIGRLEDPTLEAPFLAQSLGKAARLVSERGQGVGVAMIASNGVVTAGARHGPASLFYALFEGEPHCPRCEGVDGPLNRENLERDHKRRRSVAMTTNPKPGATWLEFPDGGSLAVDRTLAAVRLGFR